MKTKYLLSILLGLVLCSFIFISNSENNVEAKPQGKIPIGLTGPGQNSTNASVRLRSKQSGLDYYAYYGGTPQVYYADAPMDEQYTVYVCTNYPSYGSESFDASQGGVEVFLSSGTCPYGD